MNGTSGRRPTPKDPGPGSLPDWALRLPSEGAARTAAEHADRAEHILAHTPEYAQTAIALALLALTAEVRALRLELIERGA
jgi:hypothetical protein